MQAQRVSAPRRRSAGRDIRLRARGRWLDPIQTRAGRTGRTGALLPRKVPIADSSSRVRGIWTSGDALALFLFDLHTQSGSERYESADSAPCLLGELPLAWWTLRQMPCRQICVTSNRLRLAGSPRRAALQAAACPHGLCRGCSEARSWTWCLDRPRAGVDALFWAISAIWRYAFSDVWLLGFVRTLKFPRTMYSTRKRGQKSPCCMED